MEISAADFSNFAGRPDLQGEGGSIRLAVGFERKPSKGGTVRCLGAGFSNQGCAPLL